MAQYERSIKVAFDKVSGEILDAEEVFDTKKNAFDIRKQYHEGKINLSCRECEQDLAISGSKYDRLHFKHKQRHDYCIFANGNLSPKDIECFNNILKSKESERHKELKNKIGKLLLTVDGVDVNSISIDNRFIVRENEKRKPDVYCKYKDKELVFEIQLSDLTLGYILSRYNFYRKNKMYLIWILDNFDIHNQGTLERDIKYLTKYENFFKLDENSDTFKLLCDYKYSFLNDKNQLLDKWTSKSVALSEIKFDSEDFQIYFYNFGDEKKNREGERKKRIEEKTKEFLKQLARKRFDEAKGESQQIITQIQDFRKRGVLAYPIIEDKINALDDYELGIFNETLNLNNRKPPALIQWIKKANQQDVSFLEFILSCESITIDINQQDVENGNKTVLQELINNKNIQEYSKYFLIRLLLKRGYRIIDKDNSCLDCLAVSEENLLTITLGNRLSNRELIEVLHRNSKLFLIITSIQKNEITGYKFTNWIAFANNAIFHYENYWEYIELALKKWKIWDKLIAEDKKGTFQKKLQKFYSNMPEQKYDVDEIFQNLYPELMCN